MPSKLILDNQLINRVVQNIKKGNFAGTAARAAGISTDTFYEWCRRGQLEEEGPYRDFFEAISKADAECEMGLVSRLNEASEAGEWKATLEIISRRYPTNWSPKQKTQLELSKPEDQRTNVRELLSDPNISQKVNELYGAVTGLTGGVVEGDGQIVDC